MIGSREITIAGFLAFPVAGVALEALSHRPGSAIPSLTHLLGRAMRSRSGRVGLIAGWAWIGLHFFAR